MKSLKIKSLAYGLITILMLGLFTVSCQKKDIGTDVSIENVIETQTLPLEVSKQLNVIKDNLAKYTGDKFSLANHTTINNNTDGHKRVSSLKSSGEEALAYGNIAQPETIEFSRVNQLSSKSKQEITKNLNSYQSDLTRKIHCKQKKLGVKC